MLNKNYCTKNIGSLKGLKTMNNSLFCTSLNIVRTESFACDRDPTEKAATFMVAALLYHL
jgi:hypothetical protein